MLFLILQIYSFSCSVDLSLNLGKHRHYVAFKSDPVFNP